MKHNVTLVIALHAEARPLIEHFELSRMPPFDGISIYENERITLALSGIGSEAAARAVQSVHNRDIECKRAWLNIGIAGHGSLDVGQSFLANRIQDQTTMISWYPMFVFETNCQTGMLMTVEQVEKHYAEPIGYDMEAAGFISAAMRFSIAELVHSYKIVSDNPHKSVSNLTGEMISELVESKVLEIERIIDTVGSLAAELDLRNFSDSKLNAFLQRWRFTVAQQHQLRSLLRKTSVLGIDIDVDSDQIRGCLDARSVLRRLSDEIKSHWNSRETLDV